MRPVKFWRTEVKQLSPAERRFYKDTLNTLLSWGALKREHFELDIIKRILESEIKVNTSKGKTVKKWKDVAHLRS